MIDVTETRRADDAEFKFHFTTTPDDRSKKSNHQQTMHTLLPTSPSLLNIHGDTPRLLVDLRGGSSGPDVGELAMGAYDWCGNLGAPSALVAGAVVATLYETMKSGDLVLDRDDTLIVALAKKLTRMLLMSAFALETVSIFVTTVSFIYI